MAARWFVALAGSLCVVAAIMLADYRPWVSSVQYRLNCGEVEHPVSDAPYRRDRDHQISGPGPALELAGACQLAPRKIPASIFALGAVGLCVIGAAARIAPGA